MTAHFFPSFTDWYGTGPLSPYVSSITSKAGMLSLIDASQPAGEILSPEVPDLVLCQDLLGGSRFRSDLGGGRFAVQSERGSLYLAAPNHANTILASHRHRVRCVSFPVAKWLDSIEAATDGAASMQLDMLYKGPFISPSIGARMQRLWELSEGDSLPSLLLAQAAGCEILSELYRLAGTSFLPVRGGLTPWAQRVAIDMMHARLSEDIGLDQLAAEVRLSPFHFSRMFKKTFGVPPRVYLVRLRIERACELLEATDLPITEIASEVGYSSNQVLARAFVKEKYVTPTEYRRAVRDPRRSTEL